MTMRVIRRVCLLGKSRRGFERVRCKGREENRTVYVGYGWGRDRNKRAGRQVLHDCLVSMYIDTIDTWVDLSL